MNVSNIRGTLIAVAFLLLPQSQLLAMGPGNAPNPSLVDLALELNGEGSPFEGEFDTLLAGVLSADPVVLETLQSFGQHTVFAPTDGAFADLGLDENNIGDVDQTVLTQILLYHVTQGRQTTLSILKKKRQRMLFGGSIKFETPGVITDNTGRTSNIIVVNQKAQNGIIHAIDAVILPYAL